MHPTGRKRADGSALSLCYVLERITSDYTKAETMASRSCRFNLGKMRLLSAHVGKCRDDRSPSTTYGVGHPDFWVLGDITRDSSPLSCMSIRRSKPRAVHRRHPDELDRRTVLRTPGAPGPLCLRPRHAREGRFLVLLKRLVWLPSRSHPTITICSHRTVEGSKSRQD